MFSSFVFLVVYHYLVSNVFINTRVELPWIIKLFIVLKSYFLDFAWRVQLWLSWMLNTVKEVWFEKEFESGILEMKGTHFSFRFQVRGGLKSWVMKIIMIMVIKIMTARVSMIRAVVVGRSGWKSNESYEVGSKWVHCIDTICFVLLLLLFFFLVVFLKFVSAL